jgi:hypothetical protein
VVGAAEGVDVGEAGCTAMGTGVGSASSDDTAPRATPPTTRTATIAARTGIMTRRFRVSGATAGTDLPVGCDGAAAARAAAASSLTDP